MKLKIKQIEAQDIGAMSLLINKFYKENGFKYPVVDEVEKEKMILFILSNLTNPMYVYLGAWDGKKLIGFFIGYINERLWGKPSKTLVAQEMYIVPDKRGAKVGHSLVCEAMKLGIKQEVEGFECVSDCEGMAKRWERIGFKPNLVYAYMPMDDLAKIQSKFNSRFGDEG